MAEVVKDRVAASFTDWLPMAARTGGRFTSLTVMVMVSEALVLPSLTVKTTPG